MARASFEQTWQAWSPFASTAPLENGLIHRSRQNTCLPPTSKTLEQEACIGVSCVQCFSSSLPIPVSNQVHPNARTLRELRMQAQMLKVYALLEPEHTRQSPEPEDSGTEGLVQLQESFASASDTLKDYRV